jgi:hypothetical protein
MVDPDPDAVFEKNEELIVERFSKMKYALASDTDSEILICSSSLVESPTSPKNSYKHIVNLGILNKQLFFGQWRMERYLEVVEDRLRSALEQMRGSSAGEHYRTLLAALRQFVAKLANSRYGGYRKMAHTNKPLWEKGRIQGRIWIRTSD